VTAVVTITMGVQGVTGTLGADQTSLMRIIKGLCGKPGGHNEQFAMQFYNCYNFIPKVQTYLFKAVR